MLASINWHTQLNEFYSIFLRTLLFVFGTAVFYYFCGWVIPSKKKHITRISAKKRRAKPVIKDIINTFITIVVFSIATQLAFLLYYKHHSSMLYIQLNAHGWVYLVCSLPILILLHDTYFYWMHRLMHHRAIFRFVHKAHHVSQHPTAFSAFAFSPIEALIQALFVIFIPAVMPIQQGVFVAFTWMIILIVLYGHNGYEGSTTKREKLGMYKVLSTPTYHEMHHTRPNTNFGLWFVVWDKLMGTYNKNYYKSFLAILARRTK